MTAGDGWRYIAQRYDGSTGGLGEFIDFNLPLQDVDLNDVLSGHNALSATITPEYPRLKGPDGQPILLEGGTAIWAEDADGEIRGGGILTTSGFDGEGNWSLECEDLTGVSIELPYDRADYFVNVDPIDLLRHIWTVIQSNPKSNMGITIDPTSSPVRLGNELVQHSDFDLEPDPTDDIDDLEPTPPPTTPPRYATNALWREAAVRAMKAVGWNQVGQVNDALVKWLKKDELIAAKKWEPLTDKERQIRDKSIDKVGWPPEPPNPGHNSGAMVFQPRPIVNPPDGGTTDPPEEPPPIVLQYDAYKLNWYETLDLGGEIDDLAAKTPFDWHLTHRWVDDEIVHHMRVGYPRLGRRRDDLRFVVGENIMVAPDLDRDGTERANEVLFFGAGEGSLIVKARAFRRDDNRVRKVAIVSDPSVTTEAEAQRRAETELAKRFEVDDVAEITVSNHPHAPMGSVDLGDEIFVEGNIGWVEYEAWCRVVGRSMRPDSGDEQVLTLVRSDRIA